MIYSIILAPPFDSIIVIILFSVCMETTINSTAARISNVANARLGFGFKRSILSHAIAAARIRSQHEDTERKHASVVLILFGTYVFGDLFIVANKVIDIVAVNVNECVLITFGSQYEFDALCVSPPYPTAHTPKPPYHTPPVDSTSEREGAAGPIKITSKANNIVHISSTYVFHIIFVFLSSFFSCFSIQG